MPRPPTSPGGGRRVGLPAAPAAPAALVALVALVVALLLSSCGGGEVPAGAERVDVAGTPALRWGEGPDGVVLAHGASYDAASWAPQAPRIADAGFTVLAVEDLDPDVIAAAVRSLRADGARSVALVGGSAGADAILDLASARPDLPDQLVLLSPNTQVDGLGAQPKLFVASEDEPVADVSVALARTAPGDDNDVELVAGSAHAQGILAGEAGAEVLDLVVRRLREYAVADPAP